MKLIGSRGVCGNSNEVSFVTNVTSYVTNAGKLKQTGWGEAICFHYLSEPLQTPNSYKTADDISWIELGKIPEDMQSQKRSLH